MSKVQKVEVKENIFMEFESDLNIAQIVESWSPAIKQLTNNAVNESNPDKLAWMCEYAHNHTMHLNEEAVGGVSFPYQTLNNNIRFNTWFFTDINILICRNNCDTLKFIIINILSIIYSWNLFAFYRFKSK